MWMKCECGECDKIVEYPKIFSLGHNSKTRKLSEQHKKNIGKSVSGEHNTFWNGGKGITWNGYLTERVYKHPYGNKKRKTSDYSYVRVHRLVVERYLSEKLAMKIYLGRSIEIHHKDWNKQNNHISNLQIMTKSSHSILSNEHKRLS